MTKPIPQLTPEQFDALGREMDAIRRRVVADLGERDATYIRKVISVQRALELAGRGLMFAGFFPPAWLGGVTALSLSKILDNMEIGHNAMHGQYDWMRDPALTGKTFEWDIVCPSDQWRYNHNYMHHTYTNIIGKDNDLGFGVLRISETQTWQPHHLANPVFASLMAFFFEWAVMLQDSGAEQRSPEGVKELNRARLRKIGKQTLKDYVVFPALSGPLAPLTLAGNFTANIVRNLWAFMIIYCGHFPDGVAEFTEEETADESRGQWYYRQMLGSANITGSRLFHLMTGNLSHQIEHHLFPDLPAHRYPEIAVEVREICERYGLPYNTGPLRRQFGSVVRKIVTLAVPGRRRDRAARPDQATVTAPQVTRAKWSPVTRSKPLGIPA